MSLKKLVGNYSRDFRSPVPKNENVSRIMSANKAKDTSPERVFREALRQRNIRGYRKNYKRVPGRPDIAFVSKKIGIFVNGCYWHNCPKCKFRIPKTNSDFWRKKFQANKSRDIKKLKLLKKIGWQTFIIWEHELKNKDEQKKIVNKIFKYLMLN